MSVRLALCFSNLREFRLRRRHDVENVTAVASKGCANKNHVTRDVAGEPAGACRRSAMSRLPGPAGTNRLGDVDVLDVRATMRRGDKEMPLSNVSSKCPPPML